MCLCLNQTMSAELAEHLDTNSNGAAAVQLHQTHSSLGFCVLPNRTLKLTDGTRKQSAKPMTKPPLSLHSHSLNRFSVQKAHHHFGIETVQQPFRLKFAFLCSRSSRVK